ncbi:MAG TPA: amidohydrolase family protein, partial [Ktedonobacterales bacterium]|nr:amidohydrolase family protein [Ktedonobacterales bacterium]
CWRLDKAWKHLRAEAPFVRISVITQPIEETERPPDMEWIGIDRVMVSTDYPHRDQDNPRYAFKVAMPEEWTRKIDHDNATALYGLD